MSKNSMPVNELSPLAVVSQDQWPELRAISFEQRAAMIAVACRSAAELEEARRANCLPPSLPAPWPESTRQALRKWASRGR